MPDPAGCNSAAKPLPIAITGAGGLVGSALSALLERDGRPVCRLVRREPVANRAEVFWDPATARIDAAALEGLGAFVHLAGENIAAGRWSRRRKERIRSSRVEGTRLVASTLARLRRPPRVLIAASAIGYYGNRAEECLDEESLPGTGFLAETCRAWEEAAEPAVEAGIRVVKLRIGVVLSRDGGALARMLPVFRLGLGGRLGTGRQFMSWIALDDLTRAVVHLLGDERLAGAVNAVSPQPVSNAEFTRTLGRVLGRPARLGVPAFALRILFGEMGRALLLDGARILPRRLVGSGFRFLHADLAGALEAQIR